MPWTGVYAPPAPENYDPQDPYKDPVALTEQRQYMMRQHAIRVEKAKVWPLTKLLDSNPGLRQLTLALHVAIFRLRHMSCLCLRIDPLFCNVLL